MAAKKSATPSVSFDTTLTAFGNNTGIVVPAELIDELGAGKRPPVMVDLNGHEYRNTVAVRGGEYLVSVSSAVRSATGLKGGDAIHVTLTLATEPRTVEVPKDFAAALKANPEARKFFDQLSNSVQRFHVDSINAAKAAETRQRRIDKSVALFLAGKPR